MFQALCQMRKFLRPAFQPNVLKTQKHPVSSMFQTFSGFHPLVSSLDRYFQLASVCGLISASSPATVIVEMLCLFLKRSNHPLEATNPSTCSFSAIIKASSWSIVPETGILEDLQRQYHFQTASLTSAYFPDPCRLSPFLWLFSYASRISCFLFMMVCIWVLPTPTFLASFW